MAQPDPRLVAALTQCEVLSQRIAAFKVNVVVSATTLVGAGKSVLLLAISSGHILRGSW
jgi:hypothetical protein